MKGMLNYLPEPLYKAITSDSKNYLDYLSIIEEMEDMRDRCSSLSDWIMMDNPSYIEKNPELKKIRDKLDTFIFTNYHHDNLDEAYKILNNTYNLGELEEIYDEIKKGKNGRYAKTDKYVLYDLRAICLDAIIEFKYANMTYLDYMKEYVEFYNSIDNNDLKGCSTYTHMKYMKAAIQLFTTNNKYVDWRTLCTHIDTVFEKVIIYKDTDVIRDAYVECVVDFLNILKDHKDILNIIDTMYTEINNITYQYENYSYGKAALLMTMCDIYTRQSMLMVMPTLETLTEYIDNSLKNPKMLIRGLTVFDKINTNMYISIIRWILRLNNEIPFIKRNGICKLNNLQVDDYNLIMGDIEKINKNDTARDFICSTEFSKSVDKWFSSDNDAYLKLKKL